jgi:hypothetical protein
MPGGGRRFTAMKEDIKLVLQIYGCLGLPVGLVVIFFANTYQTHWRLWLAAVLIIGLVVWVWGAINGRRIRRLDAEYGLSIVFNHREDAWIQAFHGGVPAFSIPLDYDTDPPQADFTAALPAIPAADREMWRQRVTEYLERQGRYEIS